jgi:hypothetical protein
MLEPYRGYGDEENFDKSVKIEGANFSYSSYFSYFSYSSYFSYYSYFFTKKMYFD